MIIEIPDKLFRSLNTQSKERTAGRLTYNAADVLKCVVHADVTDSAGVKQGYYIEAKLGLAHVLVSMLVLARQFNFSLEEIIELATDSVTEHRRQW